MAVEPSEQWASATIQDSLVGRRPGGSAAEKARELREASPVRTRIARLLGIRTDERAWRKGAFGERATAWWLGRLPEAGLRRQAGRRFAFEGCESTVERVTPAAVP